MLNLMLDHFSKINRFYLEAMKPPARPRWKGLSLIVDSSRHHKVRLFKGMSDGEGRVREEKILMFPPHAGRHPSVVSNLVQVCQSAGYHCYVLELEPADRYNKNLDLKGLIKIGKAFRESAGEGKKVDLGICQGSWLNSLSIDQSSEKPIGQFVFAGPFDFWAGDGVIKQRCANLNPDFLGWWRNITGGIQPGWAQWWNFSMLDPKAVFWDDYEKLWELILDEDEAGLAKWRQNHDWYWSPENLPVWYFEAVDLLFKKNLLKSMVDFKKFDWPLFLYAGADDKITLPVQTFNMADSVGTDRVTKRLFNNCGHTKAFCGREQLDWVLKDLASLEQADRKRRFAERPMAVAEN